MKLALCMVVKDEMHRIEDCLLSVLPLVDSAIIVDTGSTDGTQQFIRERFGIEVLAGALDPERCYTLSDHRNRAYELSGADWVLSIDADERIEPEAIESFRAMRVPDEVKGFFGRWTNHFEGLPVFEDYKLFLARSRMRKRGLVHENFQSHIRQVGGTALWLEGLQVHHYPELAKLAYKADFYRGRLERAIRMEPDWLRYRWFLGYMDYQEQRWDEADANFARVTDARPPLFPVETLNSWMVRIDMAARRGDAAAAARMVRDALDFHAGVRDDFEVRVNFRIGPWLEEAARRLAAGDSQAVRAYRFAR